MNPDYVLGVCFEPRAQALLMVRKLRPDWQKGFFNCPGGKVEAEENPYDAMVREFKEECGVVVKDWKLAIIYHLPAGNRLYIFSSFSLPNHWHQMEDEPLMMANLDRLPPKMIENLPWIIPFCAHARSGTLLPLHVTRTNGPS